VQVVTVMAAVAALLGACASGGEPTAASVPPAASSVPSATTPEAGITPPPLVVSAPPARLDLGRTSTTAPVALAAVDADGSLDVPDDVSELGWWVGSAPMGATAGTTLIAGHIDSAEQGLGVFSDLRDAAPGDQVTVVDGLGVAYGFRVSGVQEVVKEDLPAELFTSTGPRRLALVTCSGPFDESLRRYRDNLIVWAEPG